MGGDRVGERRGGLAERLDSIHDNPLLPGDDEVVNKSVISTVVKKEDASREIALEAQKADTKNAARNKRMFGALLGTLKGFTKDEVKKKDLLEKKKTVEKRVEEKSEKEKEEVRNKKRELFEEQKKKKKDIQIIQIQMKRVEEYECWENSKKQEVNFIRTKESSQMIYWLPKVHNEKSESLLAESKEAIEKEIDERKEQFEEELVSIEKRMTADLERMQERRRLAALQRGMGQDDDTKLDDSVEGGEGDDSFMGDRKVVEREDAEDDEDVAVKDLRVSLTNGEKRVVRTEEERVVRRESDVEEEEEERRVVVKNEEEVEEQKRARQKEE